MDTKRRNQIWLVSAGVIFLAIIVVFAVREFVPTKKVLPAVLDG